MGDFTLRKTGAFGSACVLVSATLRSGAAFRFRRVIALRNASTFGRESRRGRIGARFFSVLCDSWEKRSRFLKRRNEEIPNGAGLLSRLSRTRRGHTKRARFFKRRNAEIPNGTGLLSASGVSAEPTGGQRGTNGAGARVAPCATIDHVVNQIDQRNKTCS